MKHHSRTGKPHHLADFFPHILTVAVSWTFLAWGLLFTVPAQWQSSMCIFFQLLTRITKALITFLLTTVQAYHKWYSPLFSFNSIHHHFCWTWGLRQSLQDWLQDGMEQYTRVPHWYIKSGLRSHIARQSHQMTIWQDSNQKSWSEHYGCDRTMSKEYLFEGRPPRSNG